MRYTSPSVEQIIFPPGDIVDLFPSRNQLLFFAALASSVDFTLISFFTYHIHTSYDLSSIILRILTVCLLEPWSRCTEPNVGPHSRNIYNSLSLVKRCLVTVTYSTTASQYICPQNVHHFHRLLSGYWRLHCTKLSHLLSCWLSQTRPLHPKLASLPSTPTK